MPSAQRRRTTVRRCRASEIPGRVSVRADSCAAAPVLPPAARPECDLRSLPSPSYSNGAPAASRCQRRLHPGIVNRRMLFRPHVRLPFPVQRAIAVGSEQGLQVQLPIPADLLQQVGASDRRLQRRQTQIGEQALQVFREIEEEAHHIFRLAAELRAQFRTLGGNSGGAGIEVALPRHVAAQRYQYRRAEGKFVGAQQRRDEHIARGGDASVHPQPHPAAQAVMPQHLLRFGQSQLPRIAGVLDAAKR